MNYKDVAAIPKSNIMNWGELDLRLSLKELTENNSVMTVKHCYLLYLLNIVIFLIKYC